MSAGAVLAAHDDKEASGTQDVLASLMAKEARTGQQGVGGGGKAKHSAVLRGTIEGITEHHFLAMAARAGVLQVNTECFNEMQSIMIVWLEHAIRETVPIAQNDGRNTILVSDVLSAAIARPGRVERKIVCGTGSLAAVYAAQGAGRWTGAYRAVDGSLAHPPSPFEQLAADFSSEVTRRATNKLYNNLPDADAVGSAAVEKEDEEDEEDEYEEDEGEDEQGFDKGVSKAWWSCELGVGGEEVSLGGARGIGSGCYPSGVPFKTQDEIKGNLNQPWKDSLHYIKRMQRHTGPVLPFQPFVRTVAERAHVYASGLKFCPSALQVLCAMLEDYMHELLHEAQFFVFHQQGCQTKTFPFHEYDADCDPDGQLRSLAIQPKDLQLARRIRHERA